MGTLPLADAVSYGVYRDSHLAHHRGHLLTHPEDDPESLLRNSGKLAALLSLAAPLSCIHLRNTFWGASAAGADDGVVFTLNSALLWAFPRGRPPRYRHVGLHLLLLSGSAGLDGGAGFSPLWFVLAVVPGAGPDQSTLFSRTPRRR
ncbi:hypothetical protein MJ585_17565 [Klebsiella pneumoniae]|nr:hypothetical protein MJ585_17565 [Klebsiella pneumoniae]